MARGAGLWSQEELLRGYVERTRTALLLLQQGEKEGAMAMLRRACESAVEAAGGCQCCMAAGQAIWRLQRPFRLLVDLLKQEGRGDEEGAQVRREEKERQEGITSLPLHHVLATNLLICWAPGRCKSTREIWLSWYNDRRCPGSGQAAVVAGGEGGAAQGGGARRRQGHNSARR